MTGVPPFRKCGTMPVHNRLVETDPEYRVRRMAVESFAKGFARARGFAAAPMPVIRIPVVVHVVYQTSSQNLVQAQIDSQIDILNRDYRKKNADLHRVPAPFQTVVADVRVEFALATRDPDGNQTSGVTRTQTHKQTFSNHADDIKFAARGGYDAWPSDRYLNMWVAPAITDPNFGELLGYAQFPGGPSETDGVVITHAAFGDQGTATPPFHKGRTATHEVGHWLNLLHIWGDDAGGCQRSDEVDDTPNQARDNSGCPSFPHVTCNNGPHGDMFMNYMDYVNDECMHMFSAGQVERMRATLAGPRASIASSNAFGPAPQIAASGPKSRGFGTGLAAAQVFDGVGWVPAPALEPQIRGMLETDQGA